MKYSNEIENVLEEKLLSHKKISGSGLLADYRNEEEH